jgi:hypothetical protein
MIGLVFSIIIFNKKYKLDEKMLNQISEDLQERRGKNA